MIDESRWQGVKPNSRPIPVNWNRRKRPMMMLVGMIMAGCFTFVFCATGIADEKANTGRAAEKEAGSCVQVAYESSKSSTTMADYSRTITLCDQALKADLSESQVVYIKQLKSWALVGRSQLYPVAGSEAALSENSTAAENALQDLGDAVSLNQKNWQAFLARAHRQYTGGDLNLAIEDLDSAIRLAPTEGKLWFNRGELLFAKGLFEIAAADYSEALNIDANDVQAMTGRAHCYVRLLNNSKALDDYNAVLKRAPKSPAAYLNRAECYLIEGQYAKAANDYREALTRDQNLAQAYRGVAWMYAISPDSQYNNPLVAEKSVKRAIELDGQETTENLVVLAAAQAADGDHSRARETIQRLKAGGELSHQCRNRVRFLESQTWFLNEIAEKKTP